MFLDVERGKLTEENKLCAQHTNTDWLSWRKRALTGNAKAGNAAHGSSCGLWLSKSDGTEREMSSIIKVPYHERGSSADEGESMLTDTSTTRVGVYR